MPALVAPPTVTAVSSAPHSLPFAKYTCCMRESLLSIVFSTLGNGPPDAKKFLQHPVLSDRHWPRGESPGFWFDVP